MSGWADVAQARRDWPDAPADDPTLEDLLTDARVKVAAFGPTLDDPDLPPDGWSRAQILTARDVWGAARRQGDLIGFDTFAVRVRPLTADAMALVRPYTGRPGVG